MLIVEWIGRAQVKLINLQKIILFHGLPRKKLCSPLNCQDGVCEAEACYAQVLWMKHTLLDYHLHYDHIKKFCDNTSTIHMTNNTNQHSKTKYIEIQYHFLRDHYEEGDIEIDYVLTDFQLADIFTMPLDFNRFFHLW